MTMRKADQTASFLLHLVITGDARLAAERAGVDHAAVWLRRLRGRAFAGLWDAALRMRAEMLAHVVAGRNAPSTIGRSANGPPPHGRP